MGDPARDPLPHAYLQGGCVSRGLGVRRYVCDNSAFSSLPGRKSKGSMMKGKHAQKNFGAIGAMAPTPQSLKTRGGGGGFVSTDTDIDRARPPSSWCGACPSQGRQTHHCHTKCHPSTTGPRRCGAAVMYTVRPGLKQEGRGAGGCSLFCGGVAQRASGPMSIV